MLKVDFIPTQTTPREYVDLSRWRDKINLYDLLQQNCDRPAYFWFNYKWSIPVDDEIVPMNCPEAIEQGWMMEICREFFRGTVIPQQWCNNH